nr:hypothetical protein [Endozoicomonas sp.]
MALKPRGAKQKGDKFERELATWLNENVYGREQCARAPLSGGGHVGIAGGADLIGTPELFIEAKRVEKLSFPAALEQAERNRTLTNSPEFPIVINRRNRQSLDESYVFMRLKDFVEFYRLALARLGYIKTED